jgi:hypothetical protein
MKLETNCVTSIGGGGDRHQSVVDRCVRSHKKAKLGLFGTFQGKEQLRQGQIDVNLKTFMEMSDA